MRRNGSVNQMMRSWRWIALGVVVFGLVALVGTGNAFGMGGGHYPRLAGMHFGPRRNAFIAVVVFAGVTGLVLVRRWMAARQRRDDVDVTGALRR